MGCGESKQAVATENTLTKSKSKAKKSENTNDLPVEKPTNDDANVKNANACENVEENEKVPLIGNENDNSTKKDDEKEKQKEKEKEVVDHGHEESGVGKKSDEAVVVAIEDEIKGDVEKDEDEVKGGEKENVGVVSNVTPKKDDDDEETIESIISDGISGKSDYYSPRSKGHVSEGNEDEEKDAEAKSDKEKEEVLNVEEVKVSSEKADEPQSSGEEKILASKNETANSASAAGVKAN